MKYPTLLMELEYLLEGLPYYNRQVSFVVTEYHVIGAYKVFNFILNDIQTHHKYKKLAQVAGYNECYLKQVFRLMFGIPLYQFQKQLRICEAAYLLATTDLTCKDIAFECGYINAKHLKELLRARELLK